MKKFWKCFKYCFRINKRIVPLSIISSLSRASITFIALLYSGRIVNQLSWGSSFDDILPNILILAITSAALAIVYAVCELFADTDRELIGYRLGFLIAEKSFRLPYEVFEKKEIRDMITKAEHGANGSGGVATFVYNVINNLLSSVASIVYSIVLLVDCFVSIESQNSDPAFTFLNNPWSMLTVFGMMAISLIISFVAGLRWNKAMQVFFEDNVENNRRGGYVSWLCSCTELAKDVRVYDMADLILSINEDEFAREQKLYQKAVVAEVLYKVITFLASFLTIGFTYYYVGGKAYFDIIGVGSIITMAGAISSLSSAVSTMLSAFIDTKIQVGYLSYFFDYLELPEDEEAGEPLPDGEPVLSFEHVSYKYPGTDSYALDDVSFSITPNRKTAIVGPNGAGKSTIIKLISRLYAPEKGRITLNGVDIKTLSKKEYGDLLAILFQDFSLFPFTLGENVSSGLDYPKEKVNHSLDLAGFDMKSAPEGLDTLVLADSIEGKDFSGGEKQKIAIARALYKDSKFVLLDEPTSALDPKSELEVYASIASLVEEKTSLFISHRMSSTKFCDEIIVIDKGKLVQQGTHDSLMQEEGLYRKLFSEQAKYYL